MSNTIHSRATRIFSWLVVPALLAVGGAAWSSQQPPAIGATGVPSASAAVPQPEQEPRVVIGEAVLTVVPAAKSAAPAKAKPAAKRECVRYPMYLSGSESVTICS